MKKYLKLIFILTILVFLYLYIANITLMPKSIILLQGEELELATLWGINLKQIKTSNPNIVQTKSGTILEASSDRLDGEKKLEAGTIDMKVNLFNSINVADVTVNVIPKTTVIPLGNAIGLKLYTEGILVVGMSEIEGIKPYETTGIEEGDRIVSIDNKKITNTEELIQTVNSSQGKEIQIKYIKEKEEKEMTTNIVPVKTKDNEYKLGLWVRDAAAGVGTATFYEPSTGAFALLGHGITDIDTGSLVTIANGELVTTNIVSITKGEKGNPGEIRGSIEQSRKLGNIFKNTNFGVFGKTTNKSNLQITEKEMEVLDRNKIKAEKAEIICELEQGNKKHYEIEIQKIYLNNNKDNKSMLIKVTDKELLEKTGGIIQGMSGSPIVQDGKFVGAVTHVLVNDPTTGYAVFADMMLKAAS